MWGGGGSQELIVGVGGGVATQEPTTVVVHNTTSINTAISKWKHPGILIVAYYQTLSTYRLQKIPLREHRQKTFVILSGFWP